LLFIVALLLIDTAPLKVEVWLTYNEPFTDVGFPVLDRLTVPSIVYVSSTLSPRVVFPLTTKLPLTSVLPIILTVLKKSAC